VAHQGESHDADACWFNMGNFPSLYPYAKSAKKDLRSGMSERKKPGKVRFPGF
tara:strand:- start:187 stop:345 length:159 start_codon:yes stop_codon:yes gene_type:complete